MSARPKPPAPLIAAAQRVRENAHAPYSKFKVGAALRGDDGVTYVGCNVENIAYPEGTCAEAGAIAAMIASGAKALHEIVVVAQSPTPVPPCGGCRQKIKEFADDDVLVHMTTLSGDVLTLTVAELLPGAFDANHMSEIPQEAPDE